MTRHRVSRERENLKHFGCRSPEALCKSGFSSAKTGHACVGLMDEYTFEVNSTELVIHFPYGDPNTRKDSRTDVIR